MKQRKLQLNNNWAKRKAAQLNTWMQGSVKARSAVCTATAIACLVGMAADNKDYEKLIKKYNSLVDEYNGVADDYNDAKDAIAEADTVKAGIKDLNSQHDELQKKVDAKKAELQSLTGQVDQAKKNSISDGVWQVGKDIDAGTYRATSQVGSDCYWEISTDNGDNIVQNDFPGGGYPEVTVGNGQQLKISSCGTMTKQ